MQEAYIVAGYGTAVTKSKKGGFRFFRPDDLAATVIKALIERNPTIDLNQIDEVILGAANQAGEDNRNVARMASLLAGVPVEVPGYTVNRLCASGLQSMMNGFMAIKSGEAHLILAGGTESMTRAPFVMAKAESAFSRTPEIYDTTIGWRFTNKTLSKLHHPYSMGETAENVAEKVRQKETKFDDEKKLAQQGEGSRFHKKGIREARQPEERRSKQGIGVPSPLSRRRVSGRLCQGMDGAFRQAGSRFRHRGIEVEVEEQPRDPCRRGAVRTDYRRMFSLWTKA